MGHLAQPERDMQSRIEALKNKLPRGVIVVGDGLLFKHSLFRGCCFNLGCFLVRPHRRRRSLVEDGEMDGSIVFKQYDLAAGYYAHAIVAVARGTLVVRTDDPKVDLY